MDGKVSKEDCTGLFSVAVNGWDEEANVLRKGVGIGVLGGPVVSNKLMDLVVEEFRAELVISGGRNAGDRIVRCIDGWVISFVFLEEEGGFLELDRKGLEENVRDIWSVAEEGEGNVFKDDARNCIRVERDVGRVSESGGQSALRLVWGEFQVGIGISEVPVWLWRVQVWLWGVGLSVGMGVGVRGYGRVECGNGSKVESSVNVVGVNGSGGVGICWICWTGNSCGGRHGSGGRFGGGDGVGGGRRVFGSRGDSGWGWEVRSLWGVWNVLCLWSWRVCDWRVGGWSDVWDNIL
jgi:hypothetical protein